MTDVECKVKSILEKLKPSSEKQEASSQLGLDYLNALFSIYMRADIKNIEQWKTTERIRQIDKTIGNSIGRFHEMMVATFDGWERVSDLSKKDKSKYKGMDIIHKEKKIAFEIKNKHNTLNSGSLKQVAINIKQFKKKLKWKKVYLVIMLPQPKSKLALKGKEVKKVGIEKGNTVQLEYLSGAKMYEVITKDSFFYRKLIVNIFPKILKLPKSEKDKVTQLYQAIYNN